MVVTVYSGRYSLSWSLQTVNHEIEAPPPPPPRDKWTGTFVFAYIPFLWARHKKEAIKRASSVNRKCKCYPRMLKKLNTGRPTRNRKHIPGYCCSPGCFFFSMGAFYTNFSIITTPAFLIFPVNQSRVLIARCFLLRLKNEKKI